MNKVQTNKRNRFMKIGPHRTVRALAAIHSLGRVGNRGLYAYADAEKAAIFEALSAALLEASSKFDPPAPKPKIEKPTFALPLTLAGSFEGEG